MPPSDPAQPSRTGQDKTMNKAAPLLALTLTLALGACVSVSVITQQDPAAVPQKSQPVAIVVDESSIQARQLLPLLQQQMTAQGIDVVSDAQSATWVLKFTVQTNFDATETKNGEAIAPSTTVQLALLSAEDARAGRNKPMWSASTSANPNLFNDKVSVIFEGLIQHYGQSYTGGKVVVP
jgi:hypothetical protein